jgi:hypothetical protein
MNGDRCCESPAPVQRAKNRQNFAWPGAGCAAVTTGGPGVFLGLCNSRDLIKPPCLLGFLHAFSKKAAIPSKETPCKVIGFNVLHGEKSVKRTKNKSRIETCTGSVTTSLAG